VEGTKKGEEEEHVCRGGTSNGSFRVCVEVMIFRPSASSTTCFDSQTMICRENQLTKENRQRMKMKQIYLAVAQLDSDFLVESRGQRLEEQLVLRLLDVDLHALTICSR
jgi:hypothetical protein